MTPQDTFARLHSAIKDNCDAKLFTVTVLDRAGGVARRAYTSHPNDYPTTGTKPMGQDAWRHQVIDRGEIFVANQTSGFSPFFADYPLINALGCEAVVNVPVKSQGEVVATVNVLDVAGHFTPARVEALLDVVDRFAPDLLAAFRQVDLT